MRTSYKWGLIIGGLGFAWFVGEYLFGLHNKYIKLQPVITNFELIIPILCIGLGLRQVKLKDFNGSITFSEAFKEGLIMSAIAACLSVVGVCIYFKAINPGWTDFMIETSKQVAKEKGESIAKAADFAKIYFSLNSYIVQSFIGTLGFGGVISLIVALVIRNKKS
ncbi:MAG: DUF4199 domain-containing protein [Bacteroidia bacterium]